MTIGSDAVAARRNDGSIKASTAGGNTSRMFRPRNCSGGMKSRLGLGA
jgi:hypothetical protein